jgi:hypothetical protein
VLVDKSTQVNMESRRRDILNPGVKRDAQDLWHLQSLQDDRQTYIVFSCGYVSIAVLQKYDSLARVVTYWLLDFDRHRTRGQHHRRRLLVRQLEPRRASAMLFYRLLSC